MPFGTTHLPVTGYPYPLPKSTPTSNGEGVGRKLITHYKWGGYKMYPWGIFIIYYKVNYLLDMGGIGEGKKWIIIIWIWVWTRVGLPIPSPVADIYIYAHGRCWCLLFDVHLFFWLFLHLLDHRNMLEATTVLLSSITPTTAMHSLFGLLENIAVVFVQWKRNESM